MQEIEHVPRLVAQIYESVRELEGLFPGRKFTPDGHLVGSIGEVIAAHRYGLRLLRSSHAEHDAETPEGALVQIKATQVRNVAMRSECNHLLVLKLGKDGSAVEVYNGPGSLAWEAAGKLQKNGQRAIGLSKLQSLMKLVPTHERLTSVRPTSS